MLFNYLNFTHWKCVYFDVIFPSSMFWSVFFHSSCSNLIFQALAVAGINSHGRHRSIDYPGVLRTPPDSSNRVRASYHTPGLVSLVQLTAATVLMRRMASIHHIASNSIDVLSFQYETG